VVDDGLLSRFWAKVDVQGENDCWEWTAGKQTGGYGSIRDNGKTMTAHRLSLMIHSGPPTDAKMYACHECNNPGCVNPKHLRWDMPKGNHDDRVKAGTHSPPPPSKNNPPVLRGADNPRTKLTPEQVLSIREDYEAGKHTALELSKMHEISKPTIYQILSRRSWKHI
jgi:hypothetical protein